MLLGSASGKSKSEKRVNEEQVDPLPISEAPTAVTESRFKTLQMDIDWNLDPNTGSPSLHFTYIVVRKLQLHK